MNEHFYGADDSSWIRSSLIACSTNLEYIVLAFLQKFVVLENSPKTKKCEIISRVDLYRETDEEVNLVLNLVRFLFLYLTMC